jgi:tetratricopeptide (TPR) repeat protein
MRRIDLRSVLVLVVVGSWLGAAGLAAYQVQVERTARLWRTRADAAEAEGRFEQALAALVRYLALRPDDVAAQERHAWLLDRTATTAPARARAAAGLERVLRRQPGRADVRRRLAELEVERGRYAEARAHLGVLTSGSPADAGLEELAGRCDEAGGDFASASLRYQRVLGHDPKRPVAAARLADLRRLRLDDPAGADRVLDELVRADPGSVEPWLVRSRHRRAHDLAGADDDLERARTLAPDDPGVLIELAQSARRRSDLAGARAVLDRGAGLYPRDPRFPRSRAELEIGARSPDEAVRALRRGLGTMPGDAGLRWTLANLLAEQGDTAELACQIDRLRADPDGYPPAALDYLGAWLAFDQGRWAEAADVLERVEPALTAWPEIRLRAVELLARCYGPLGRPESQAAAYRRALDLNPRHPAARLNLAATLAAEGHVDRAIEEYRGLLPEVPEARGPLARLLIRRNEDLPADQRHWDEVDRLLAGLARAADDPEAVAVLGAESLAAKGRPDAAREQFRRLLSARPDDPALRRDWAQFLLRYGPAAEVGPALRTVLAGPGTAADTAWARRSLAVWLAAPGDPARAREALALLGDGRPATPDDCRARARVLATLGGLRDRRETIALLEGLDGAGRDPAPGEGGDDRWLLAMLYESVGDWPRARALITGLGGPAVTDPAALARLADALLRHGEAEAAAPLVARLGRAEPAALATADLEARLLQARGGAAAAADRLSAHARVNAGDAGAVAALLDRLGHPGPAEPLYRAAAARPDRPEGVLALAGFLARTGRGGEALDLCERAWTTCRPGVVAEATVAVLDAWGGDAASLDRAARRLEAEAGRDPVPVAVLTSLASVRELQGRFGDAEQLYRRALGLDGRDPVALNNLALLVASRGGDGREPLDLINRAIEQAGPRPALLDTRAVVRLAAGDGAGAVDDLTEAAVGSASGPVYFHLAQAHLACGRPDDSIRAYRRMRELASPADHRAIAQEERLRPGRLAQLERLAVSSTR